VPDGQILRVVFAGKTFEIELPLAGAFQASNALVAAALAIGLGDSAEMRFRGARENQRCAGTIGKSRVRRRGAPIFVDYAHTPDALESVF
jgi:UDP-N-acetylmuramoyl-L-alanyl-D-glutamate--2,6-diaminopimelate ligase